MTVDGGAEQQEEKANITLSIMCVVVETLIARGIKNATAVLIAADIVKNLAAALGGSSFYLPKQTAIEHANRAAAIYAEFDGKNHVELARKYGVCTRSVYAIVRRMKEQKPAAAKPDAATIAKLLKNRS